MFVHSHPLFLGDKFMNDISTHTQVNKQKKMPVHGTPWNTWNILLMSVLCHSWISMYTQVAQQFKYILVIYRDPDSTNHTTDSIFNFHVFHHPHTFLSYHKLTYKRLSH